MSQDEQWAVCFLENAQMIMFQKFGHFHDQGLLIFIYSYTHILFNSTQNLSFTCRIWKKLIPWGALHPQ